MPMNQDSTAMALHRACWQGKPTDRSIPLYTVGTSECLPTFVLRHCFNNIAASWPALPARRKLSER